MYNSKIEYLPKYDITIEIIKHNNHIIIKRNFDKRIYVGYTKNQAINRFREDCI